MKRLLIVGAGGFGREVLSWVQDIPNQNREWEIGGFLNSIPTALDAYHCGYKIIGDPSTYNPLENDLFVCAIGSPHDRLRVVRNLKERGACFITLIHPTAVVGSRCTIGEGCIFCPGTIITVDVTIGNFVILNAHASVGHDAFIGDGCTISGHCDITGFARLGEGVFLGTHAAILPGAKIGDYAIIGAGSVVLSKVLSGVTVMGVPATKISGFK